MPSVAVFVAKMYLTEYCCNYDVVAIRFVCSWLLYWKYC